MMISLLVNLLVDSTLATRYRWPLAMSASLVRFERVFSVRVLGAILKVLSRCE